MHALVRIWFLHLHVDHTINLNYPSITTGQLVTQIHMHFDQCIALDRSEVCSPALAAVLQTFLHATVGLSPWLFFIFFASINK